MSIAEGIRTRIYYKQYASDAMLPTTEPAAASDPGTSQGIPLYRAASSLQLVKDTYQSDTIRSDRQMLDFRHGLKRVEGSVSGPMLPFNWFDLINKAHRATVVGTITKSNTELTSCEMVASTSSIIFGGGNPETEGFRVGDIVRFTNMSVAANNSRNFVILNMGGTNTRNWTVWPAPADNTTDNTFSVTRPNDITSIPENLFTNPKIAIEVYHEDIDLARLYTECRITGYRLSFPVGSVATAEVSFRGRNMQTFASGDSPFFVSSTSGGLINEPAHAAQHGYAQVRVIGSATLTTLPVVTSAEVVLAVDSSAEAVIGQNISPDIILGAYNVTGTVTMFFQNQTLLDGFNLESEYEMILYAANGTANNRAISIFLPRVKFTGAETAITGDAGQLITMSFQALRRIASGVPSIVSSTIKIHEVQ